jgi:hypothetical protein
MAWILMPAAAVRVEPLRRADVVPQAQQHHLGRVDHGAAADRHQQIRFGGAGGGRAVDHALTRGMRSDPGIESGEFVAKRTADLAGKRVIAAKRAARGDENP